MRRYNKMIKILFVCHGNICRSTMAEYVWKDLVLKEGIADQFYIDSAATSQEEIGNGVHRGTQKKLREVGIACGNHRARQMTYKDYMGFDYLIGMDDANLKNMNRIVGGDSEHKLYKLLSFAGSERSIADPWYTGNFDETYEDVCTGCHALLKWLRKNGKIT